MNKKNTMMESVPAANELRKVPGFNPLNFLRRTVSQSGEKVLKLDLPYKKLWFRLACPNGRMLLNPLRITDQMAIFEARVYSDMDAAYPFASFTSTRMKRDVPGGKYIQAAQDEALNEALDNAGFGIQLCDVAQVSDCSGLGSEIPLPQGNVEQTVSTTVPPQVVQQTVVSAPKVTQPIAAPAP